MSGEQQAVQAILQWHTMQAAEILLHRKHCQLHFGPEQQVCNLLAWPAEMSRQSARCSQVNHPDTVCPEAIAEPLRSVHPQVLQHH